MRSTTYLDDKVKTAQLVRAVASEVNGLDEICAKLESSVLSVLVGNETDAVNLTELQSLDRLRQGLREVANLTEALAEVIGEDHLSSAAAEQVFGCIVQSSTQSRVLSFLKEFNGPTEKPSLVGEVTLF